MKLRCSGRLAIAAFCLLSTASQAQPFQMGAGTENRQWLPGIAQGLTAKEGPPSLKVIVPQVACGDCYSMLWYPAGMNPGPGREARKLSPGAELEYATAIQHPDLDDWWRERTTQPADV